MHIEASAPSSGSTGKVNEVRLDDSTLNESVISSNTRTRRKKTLEDYEFVINENNKYKSSDLGKGSYGTVKRVRDKGNGKVYAMKIMNKKAIFEYSTKENLKREITIQKKTSHPHIIKLHTYFEDLENVYLILEYAEHGSLFTYLRRKQKFSEGEAFVYFFQTCLGIDYLHKNNIIHRDLKPENLLLDAGTCIKLCDFGWSAENYSKRYTFCGTVDYMAPEMIKNQPYDHRLDIWCIGILLYEMLHGRAPFAGKTDQEKTRNISINSPFDFDASLSSDVVDLIRKILKPAPADRISMTELFRHPWMKKQEKIHKINIVEFVKQNGPEVKDQQAPQETKPSKSEKSGGSKKQKILTVLDQGPPIDLLKQQQLPFKHNDTPCFSNGAAVKDLFSANINENQKSKQSRGIDIEQFMQNYGVFNNEEMGLLSRIENLPTSSSSNNNNINNTALDDSPEFSPQRQDSSGFETEVVEKQVQAPKQNQNAPLSSSLSLNLKKMIKTNLTIEIDDTEDTFSGDGYTGNMKAIRTFTPQRRVSSRAGTPKGGLAQNGIAESSRRQINTDLLEVTLAESREENDEDFAQARMSRVSKKNIEDRRANEPKKDEGFLDRLLTALGCISRGGSDKKS